ncbi:putative poly(A) polymerase [Xylaria bambusicola]|uniref:putative poly(A) polymerase n=1 Tax=Xylaria bambusicola TaxID=326684 RepID=UPI0020079198|nr:putative poly(A) polymerase [Xylaria bambusicola]KAI0516725.1 putative poly(A) polymerase [Xylaria bambusicola]
MASNVERIKVERDEEELTTQEQKAIVLLPAEKLLREFLLECAQHFPGLEIWITGGWVRDRLLGIPSSDLDLALSKVTGREFGKFLERFSAEPEIESKYRMKADELGIPDCKFTRFHVMERNAEMSKKLETAGGNLFGLEVDLVNLRKEVYDSQSRTPDMEFGTPEEDAFRRDATVNAMFFNLEKQEVVDLTGRGLQDLAARIMRTPLDPRQTFMDDPLRVLRLIRVGSKLGFGLHPEVTRYMKEDEIRRALDTMITRDRINIELFKMIRDANAAVAFKHIFESNLYTPVFLRLDSSLLDTLETEFPILGLSASPPWPITWPRAYRLLAHLLKDSSTMGKMVQSEENVDHVWVMAAYAPIAGLRQNLLGQAIQEATTALRLPAKISKVLESALRNFDSILEILDTTTTQSAKTLSRSLVGMAIRSWGATWSTQVTYVMLAQVVYAPQTSTKSVPSAYDSSMDEFLTGPLLKRFSAFADFVVDQDLRDAHLQRPLLNGNEIQILFGLQKGGKYLKSALDGLMAWQLEHVTGQVEDAKAWLLSQQERFDIPS